MKTTSDLEKDIVDITNKIYRAYPELSKYISEMPMQESGVYAQNLKEYYNSLEELINEYAKTHEVNHENQRVDAENPGYPPYPPEDEIYNQEQELANIYPGNISKKEASITAKDIWNEKELENNISGDDFDVPGSEPDDRQESVDGEDEENNYFNTDGDNYFKLEEDHG